MLTMKDRTLANDGIQCISPTKTVTSGLLQLGTRLPERLIVNSVLSLGINSS